METLELVIIVSLVFLLFRYVPLFNHIVRTIFWIIEKVLSFNFSFKINTGLSAAQLSKLQASGKALFTSGSLCGGIIVDEKNSKELQQEIEKEIDERKFPTSFKSKVREAFLARRFLAHDVDIRGPENAAFIANCCFIACHRNGDSLSIAYCLVSQTEHLKEVDRTNQGKLRGLYEFMFGRSTYANYEELKTKYTSLEFKETLMLSCAFSTAQVYHANTGKKLGLAVQCTDKLINY